MASFLERISATSNAKGAGSTYMPLSEPTNRSSGQAENVGIKQEQPKTDNKLSFDTVMSWFEKPTQEQKTYTGASKSIADKRDELVSQLKHEEALAGFISTVEQEEEHRRKIADLSSQISDIDVQLGNAPKAYVSSDRADAVMNSWGDKTAAAYLNVVGNVQENKARYNVSADDAAYNSFTPEQQAEYDRLIKQRQQLEDSRAYVSTVEQSDELERQWQEINRQIEALGVAPDMNKANTTYAKADEHTEKYTSEFARAKEGQSKAEQAIIDLTHLGLDVAADAAASLITGGIGGRANMLVRSYGAAAGEARANGDPANVAMGKGITAGLIELGSEMLGGGFGKVYGSSLVSKAVDKAVKSPIVKGIISSLGEGLEEGVASVLQFMANQLFGWGGSEEGGYFQRVLNDVNANKEEIIYEMALGAIIGVFGSGQNIQNGNAPLAQSDMEMSKSEKSPQKASDTQGDNQIPPNTTGAPTNAPDALNTAEQPQQNANAADILADVAMGRNNASGTAPKTNLGGGTRTSQTAGTVSEADITNEARRTELAPFVVGGRFDYVPDTNAKQTERATMAIMKDGWKKASEDFKADVAAGKSGKDLVARGAVLLNNLSNSEASAGEYMDMVDSYIELMHRAGETLQAGKIIQQLTPEGRLYLILKTQDKINRNMTKAQRAKAGKAQGVEAENAKVRIAPELIEKYRAAQNDAERDAIITEIQQNMAEQIPATLEEKLNAWRYTAMLGNLKTQARNVTGNALSVTAKMLKDRLAAVGEMIAKASGADIERTRSVVVSPELFKAAWNDFPANKDAALGEQKYSSAGRQIEKAVNDKRRVFDNKILEKWRTTTQKAMEAGDALFARVAYADALGGWLQAHNLTFETATDEQLTRARDFAAKEAQEATFRDKNQFSDLITGLGTGWRNSENKMAKAAGIVLEGIVPFRKTPANVLARAEEYSPLGIANTILKATKAAKGEAEVNEVINSAAKAATGSALAAVGYFLAAAGRLRGMEDDEELDKAQKAAGAMDWSFVTEDGEYIALNQFAPMTVPLFMGVRLAELTQGQDIEPKDIFQIIKGTTAPMLEMSMLSGLDNAFTDLSKYGDDSSAFGQFIQNALMSYAQQYIPAIVGQLEQFTEENRQTTYTDKDNPWLDTDTQYALGKASARVPVWDYQQTDYIDMWGRKTEQGNGAERFVNAFLNPTYTSKNKAEAVDTELERLHEAVKDLENAASVYPSFVSRSTKLDKSGKTMTQEQYQQYKIDMGSKSRELAKDFVESSEYKKLSDEQRAKVLSQLYNLASSQALKTVKREQGVSGKELKTDWDMEAGLSDPAKFLAETAIAKANAEKRGETFSTDGRDALAYYATKGFNNRDMDKMADDMLGKRQGKAYDAFREGKVSPKETMDLFTQMDGEKQDGKYNQTDVGSVLLSLPNMTDEQKAVIWENTQTGSTDWATYLAKHR